jgi:hypothetical protein
MWHNIPIYHTGDYLVLQLNASHPERWYKVTSISDRDKEGRLFGTEAFLYEESEISFEKVIEQFRDFENINVEERGLIYIQIRVDKISHRGPGFGRSAYVGIDIAGYLSLIRIPWDEPGAAIPFVDANKALAGIVYQEGEP